MKLSNLEADAKSSALSQIVEKASDGIAERLKGLKKGDKEKAKEIMASSEEPKEEMSEEESEDMSIEEIDAKIAELQALKASKKA